MNGPILLPISGSTGGTGTYATGPIPPDATFETTYTILANNTEDLERVQLTFCDFNEPRKIRFFQEALNVVWKQYTEESISLKTFFHPLQDFSGFQKQTFSINPGSYFYYDPGYFEDTNGYIGLLFATASYLPEAGTNREIYWSYGPTSSYGASGAPGTTGSYNNYVMGDFLVLSGAIKEGATGNGWDSRGFYFTNPTEEVVKLKIITAN